MKKYSFTLLVLIIFFNTSCNNHNNEVVVYTSVDQVFSEPILKDFEKETGIKVKAVYDTEETKSTGVLNRLISEKNNTQCDLFWSGDPIRSNVLKNKDILMAYEPELAKDIKSVYKDPQGYWIGFSARARVLIYNKTLLAEKDVPKSIFDLTNQKYNSKVTIANPLFGTTTFHIAALFSIFGDSISKAFLTDLKTNNIIIATSNGDVKKRVMQGEAYCGITDTDDAFEAMKEDNNIGIVFLDQDKIGSLIIPNTVSLLKNSPNTENAKILMDYLLSKNTEAKLAISCAQMPLHKGVETPDEVPSLDNIKAMNIDYKKTAQKLQEIQNYLKEWVEN
ncbi:MAG: iron ABC transporter substrate-binding protein [Bacteroidetes bacterium 4572_112]|nr:MAG: iron ABC transporter substrate-binding protein [Bacteroidetes bacterium 4572_112]